VESTGGGLASAVDAVLGHGGGSLPLPVWPARGYRMATVADRRRGGPDGRLDSAVELPRSRIPGRRPCRLPAQSLRRLPCRSRVQRPPQHVPIRRVEFVHVQVLRVAVRDAADVPVGDPAHPLTGLWRAEVDRRLVPLRQVMVSVALWPTMVISRPRLGPSAQTAITRTASGYCRFDRRDRPCCRGIPTRHRPTGAASHAISGTPGR
jgi:hypothetical protein